MKNKKCAKCGEAKPEDAFYRTRNECNQCKYKSQRDWIAKNRERLIERGRQESARNRERYADTLYNHFLTHPCVDCGTSDPLVLEFDHVRGEKVLNVSLMQKKPVEEIEREIAKCDVRCANCHRRKTHIDRQTFRCLWGDLGRVAPGRNVVPLC